MIIVSDAGPLQYLFLVGHLEVLPAMFGSVVVPDGVISIELRDMAAPSSLRAIMQSPPSWLTIHEAPINIHPSLTALGLGERQAISLMLELKGDLMLCDDALARKKASLLGVLTTGTLGLIEEAAFRGLVDFEAAIQRLIRHTNFRHDPPLIERVRKMHHERLQSRGSKRAT